MVAEPIGGQFISSFGGLLGFIPYTGGFGTNTPANLMAQGALPSTTNQNLLDCRAWQLELQSFGEDATHTGSFGSQGWEKTAEGFVLSASLMWDLRKQPDLITKNGIGGFGGVGQHNFNAGFQLWAYIGDNANYPTDIGAEYYYAPSAKILQQVPIIDANSKQMVGLDVKIIGNSRIFKLAAEVYQMNAYMAHLYGRDMVF